ncbi:PRC-barrel domain-containing protein [Halorubrum laminariae]|uniref:PRC-barrel domain-containing protein n=1 Tax=Halorubrum laminariae TaxID=1433523 RepID=A0ABD6BWF9_9EURY|nr:PRC-barrel domain-containing protein [Halorubrum laminariae]
MNAAPQEITSLVGREVYSNNGVFVGEIEDVRLDLDAQAVTGLALAELNHELFAGRVERNTGVIVPYRWVRAVGDVVLVNDVIERFDTESDEQEADAGQSPR